MFKKKKKSSLLYSKAQKENNDESKFYIHYGLKQKLMIWILSPLVIGILITVAFSFLIIIYVEPMWFNKTGIVFKYFKMILQNRIRGD